MIYSKSKNFIFIHIYKNAGTSIKDALKLYNDTYSKRRSLDGALGKLGISSKFAPPWHGTAREIKNYVGGSIWDSAYTFAVIRNPWDWQVSLYTYMLKCKTHHQHRFISKIKSFDEYISWRCQENFCSQSCFLTGDSGNIIVNDVFRFESINSDIQRLESHIGCNIHWKKLNQSRSDSYRQYYSSESREMVGKFFREDIDRFGYEF